jgi:hypothetical protein
MSLSGKGNLEMQMDEEAFWKLMSSLELITTDDITYAELDPLCEVLSGMSVEDIHKFEDILTEKLFALDTRAHAVANIDERLPGYISSDGFLYARCYVVGKGKQFYEQVLNDPSKMPNRIEFEFEPLLFVAQSAYTQKTGNEDFEPKSELSYETGSNEAGWPATDAGGN